MRASRSSFLRFEITSAVYFESPLLLLVDTFFEAGGATFSDNFSFGDTLALTWLLDCATGVSLASTFLVGIGEDRDAPSYYGLLLPSCEGDAII